MSKSVPTFVMLCGKRYAGKDLSAALMHAMTGWDRDSFAYAVKVDCAKKHSLDLNLLLHNQLYKDAHRQLLIDHGTNRRATNIYYWAEEFYKKHSAADSIVIGTDLRFCSELEYLRDQGARVITIRVVASDEARASRGWRPNPKVDTDPSECDLDHLECDLVIENNGPGNPDVSQAVEFVRERLASAAK